MSLLLLGGRTALLLFKSTYTSRIIAIHHSMLYCGNNILFQPASTWTDSREKLYAPSPTITTTVNASWGFLYEYTLSPYTTVLCAKEASTSSLLHCTKAALVIMEAVYCGCHRVVVLPIMRSLFCGCISAFLFLAAAAPHNHHQGHSMTTWSSLKRVQVHIISDCALRALMQILLSGQRGLDCSWRDDHVGGWSVNANDCVSAMAG